MRINKKGELSTKLIVGLLVLLASFVIILLLLFRLNLGATTDKEICHNSVVLASKGKGLVGRLDCKTSYVCISGGGKCKDISATITREVNPDNPDEIMKAIADEMADCWWMFGEGELDYLKWGEKRGEKDVCAICSIVKFDERILEKSETDENYRISYKEFYEYLNNTKKDESQKYLGYLYNFYNVNNFEKEANLAGVSLDNDFILSDKKYVIVTGYNIHSFINFKEAFGRDYIFPPYYIDVERVSNEQNLGCDEYITKS